MSELSDKHPIEGLMSSAMQGLKEMIDVNTIVGSPITTSDGTVIMPISKVALGFGVGGSEFPKNKKLLSGEQEEVNNLFGGGTGGSFCAASGAEIGRNPSPTAPPKGNCRPRPRRR